MADRMEKVDEDIAFGQPWQPRPVRPSFSTTGKPEDIGRRKSSIQFHTAGAEETIRRESLVPRLSVVTRRRSSPPPKLTYQRGVSFDTFDNRDATDYSLTLNYKHKDYVHTRRSRTFLCGTDQNDYSEDALQWLIDELVDDGDEIVCLRVVEKDSKIASEHAINQGRYRDEAQKLLNQVIEKNSHEDRAISLILELAVGRVEKVIQRMIQIYEPAVLVVGTRGRSGVQGLLPSSVSKYCLQSSPIPVIVVRPSKKRENKKKMRQADPHRQNYHAILEQTHGGHMLDKSNRNSIVGSLPSATDQEADMVAKEIGLPKNFEKRGNLRGSYGGPIRRVTSRESNPMSDREESPSPTEPFFIPAGYMRTLTPDPVDRAIQSPLLANLDWSEDEDKSEKTEKPESEDHTTTEEIAERKETESRPSFKDKPDWLKDILKPDDKKKERRPSHGRSPSR